MASELVTEYIPKEEPSLKEPKEILFDPSFSRIKLCREMQSVKEIRDNLANALENEIDTVQKEVQNQKEKKPGEKSPEEIKNEVTELLQSLKEEISRKKEVAEVGTIESVPLDLNSVNERLEDLNVVLERLQEDSDKLKNIREHIGQLEVFPITFEDFFF